MLGMRAPSPDSRFRPCSRLTHPGSTPASTGCVDRPPRKHDSDITHMQLRMGTQDAGGSTTAAYSRPNTMSCKHTHTARTPRSYLNGAPRTGDPGVHHTQAFKLLSCAAALAEPRGQGVWVWVWSHTCRRVSRATCRSSRLHTAGTATSPSLTTRPQNQTSYGTGINPGQRVGGAATWPAGDAHNAAGPQRRET
jgi:hypothetical protein